MRDEQNEKHTSASREEWLPVFSLAGIFLIAQFLALTITPQFIKEDMAAFEEGEEDSLSNILIILAEILVITAVLLYLAKKGKKKLVHYFVLAVFALAIWNTLSPLFAYVLPPSSAGLLGLISGIGLAFLFYKYPEWYVIDSVGVLICAGIATILGISLAPFVIIIFLVLLAVYDALAVYKTRHMLDLADVAVEKKLPLMFVVPREFPYSFLKEKGLKEKLDSGEKRDAMFMGLGDVVMPSLLAVSSVTFLGSKEGGTAFMGIAPPFVVAFSVVLGSFLGFVALMWFVMKGKPQAGLPFLNSGAILGYMLSALLVYGELGLSLSW
ncbi:MAG TPA: hypothetical protein EYP29_02335 [Thermoplasmata archaeon]|nr:hypothetical protein [Thermoplasmata archaeon]